ncbi:LLM class flavin-dependent oxidoreductase [Bailinhaonella thermotolerans]|uniref:LLM class flavin-dependent oxidoreductase n=1 Tax=Bailinhaonella thermotolerans TaxID=1070861 RepID=A0A3A4AXJ7_9ACTN|nr:LLM class flavin-dependent oxidoreductase [Bailinhaonella thermotolerans]RJL33139.1 LLM class flavin-dependent oxidoreductase [Bailinhaonella thermotolerans]
MTAVRFGLDVSTSAAPGADPVAYARLAEELGFDFLSASDHPAGSHPTYETWTMLSWIAAATSRVQIATRVLGVPYRNPALVAKMAETFDRLSGGRLILGLGGGHSDDEFRQLGLKVPTPREKIDGLEEAVLLTRGLWSEPAFTFKGSVHHTDAADLEPKPARRIPIWLGTFGPRALAVTGRLADGWIPSMSFAPPERVVPLRDRLLSAAEQAGRDPAEITLAYNIQVTLAKEPDPTPTALIGPPSYIADRLHHLTTLGFTAFNLMPTTPTPESALTPLATQVLPTLR